MESKKSKRRWMLTKVLVSLVVLFLLGLVTLTAFGYTITQLVIAYGTFVTFSAAIVAANFATTPSKD